MRRMTFKQVYPAHVSKEMSRKAMQWVLDLKRSNVSVQDVVDFCDGKIRESAFWTSRFWHDGDFMSYIEMQMNLWNTAVTQFELKECYLSSVGAFVPIDGMVVVDTVEYPRDDFRYRIADAFDKLVVEKANVRFVKGENGSHWYAKVGKLDVVVDGEQRWGSRSDAERAFRIWKRRHKEQLQEVMNGA